VVEAAENNNEVVLSTPAPVGIDPALWKMAEESKAVEKAQDAQVLTSLDGFTFTSWGYSELKVTRGGEEQRIRIPIKSIGISDITEALEANAPTPPSMLKPYKKDTPEAKALTNGRYDVIVREIDEADPHYLALRRKHEREVGQLFVMYGIALDLKDPQTGEIVIKGAQMNEPNEIPNRQKAIDALRKLGLSQSHYTQLMTDIRKLTADVEEAEREE